MGTAREPVLAAPSPATADAKLALLEDFQRCTDVVGAAQRASEWLVAHAGAERSVFAAPDHVRGMLTAIAGAGISPRQFKRFSLPLDDPGHPLVSALTNGTDMTLHTALEVKVPLFGNSPFIAVKVGGDHGDPAR